MMTRNSEALESFTKYCKDSPNQRFWQALRNWSKYDNIMGFRGNYDEAQAIYWANNDPVIEDTFNLEGLEGTLQ
jgi:hypothetical protein